MLPDPRVKDEWRAKGVLWYPARFFKHHPHTQLPKYEFEFRFMECIRWRMTEDDYMQPSRHYSQDRASCEEMLKVELQPEQVSTPLSEMQAIEHRLDWEDFHPSILRIQAGRKSPAHQNFRCSGCSLGGTPGFVPR
jgi:hypothetical protein